MIKTRIAPSPTGDPHVGTAYIALFNYCFAKKHGGKFILRIEDTDQARSAPEYEQGIMDALRWLDIQWDEGPDVGGPSGPYRQSERKEIYEEHCQKLLDSQAAYRCFCTSERLDQMRIDNQAAGKPTFGYDRHCRSLTEEQVQQQLDAGTEFVVRLKMPVEGDSIIKDRLRGEIVYPNYQMDDQVLMKSDGYPTYHLANVVDDHLMGVTHVIRAEEWIPSTPKHQVLYDSFGWERPEFIHMPLLRNKDKSKISKRKNPTSVSYYKRIGILPEVMRNFLALIGYSFGNDVEKFTLKELIETFDISRVSLGGPVFDLDKLNWLNGLYVREMSHDDLHAAIMEHVLNSDYVRDIVPHIQERIERLDQFMDKSYFFFASELEFDEQLLLGKKMAPEDMVRIFTDLSDEFDGLKQWTTENIEGILRGYVENGGVKPRAFFMPVRIAMTGRKASPGLFETMEVLGKPLCQERFRLALQKLQKMVEDQGATHS